MQNNLGYLQNRELSWLKFNERVLEEATDYSVPLLERLKYISIFYSNLDEFFMIRVGSLLAVEEAHEKSDKDFEKADIKEQLDEIYKSVRRLYNLVEQSYYALDKELRKENVTRLKIDELSLEEKEIALRYFKTAILPILSPLIIDSHHPFPHLKNKTLNIITRFKKEDLWGIIQLPTQIPEVFFFPGADIKYVYVDEIVRYFVHLVFPNYTIQERAIIRVTRNEDLDFSDDSTRNLDPDEYSDFRKVMKKLLNRRKRLAPVRLETSEVLSLKLEKFLLKKLNLTQGQVFVVNSPMTLKIGLTLPSKLNQEQKEKLCFPKFKPQTRDFLKQDIMKAVQKQDILLSYPFYSMNPFINLLKEASVDPDVISIKITIYRLADQAKIVDYLCQAAENGKDVTVLIELRARFDEINNILRSERLEEAGCNIYYGFEDYKVHSKVCLITKRERGEVTYITQIGTGNYNESTAKLYTDLTLITYNQDIGKDVADYFKNMGIGNLDYEYKHLLVAPNSFKTELIKLIDEEISKGSEGTIYFKINSIADVDIMKKLSEASRACVKVHLIVRGICRILPAVEGFTDNIKITSIVGRFLEHSRIYIFGAGNNMKMYISSADCLPRNTERRVEVTCPIYDKEIQKQILLIFNTCLKDNVKAREMTSNGNLVPIRINAGEERIDSQKMLIEEAINSCKIVTKKKRSFIEILKAVFKIK